MSDVGTHWCLSASVCVPSSPLFCIRSPYPRVCFSQPLCAGGNLTPRHEHTNVSRDDLAACGARTQGGAAPYLPIHTVTSSTAIPKSPPVGGWPQTPPLCRDKTPLSQTSGRFAVRDSVIGQTARTGFMVRRGGAPSGDAPGEVDQLSALPTRSDRYHRGFLRMSSATPGDEWEARMSRGWSGFWCSRMGAVDLTRFQ